MNATQPKVIGAVLLLLAGCITLPAWAINKCTAPDGKVSFQDKDCSPGRSEVVTLRPDPAAAPPPAAASKPATGQPKTIHTGPRGGRYTIDNKGRKRYLPREKSTSTRSGIAK